MKNKENWTICIACNGRGKKSQKLKKNVKLKYQKELDLFKTNNGETSVPIRPIPHQKNCLKCNGTGLQVSTHLPIADKENYPHVAIIGGGIGGIALALACLHRKIPFTLFERDISFDERTQGYGLTLQQASNAIKGIGILSLDDAIISTRHLVHTTDGTIIGEWGMRKWLQSDPKKLPRRTNIHIARQSLRFALLEQLGEENIQWGHQLLDLEENENGVDLKFRANEKIKNIRAYLVVGTDGIRSTVRKLLIGEDVTPLRYLGCIVILGICPLDSLMGLESTLLDSATVFQTANGNERIYMMPFSSKAVMWQLSFPIDEKEAKALSAKGSSALKEEACRRTQWHFPIPEILLATNEDQISGYPVYDRELLKIEMLNKSNRITLIGDAAHPMSPFKGQGANQAILDALDLAREIYSGCGQYTNWKEIGLRESVLSQFETKMLERSESKVKESERAAEFLHSDLILKESNEPRGRHLL